MSEPTVLDIGCGVGKMARFLAINPALRYIGFDIYLPAIKWCQREFARVYGDRFRFEHFDGHSSMYNPGGTVKVQDYRFPVGDDSIDLAIGASIFTHLYEEDMRHYFVETVRVLRAGGVAVFSIHTLDEVGAFFPDSQGVGERNIFGNEQVMLIDKAYFISIGKEHGLRLLDAPGRLCGQELIVFQKSNPKV
ncbi:class I SAM-dependent methyltransferase [Nitrincola sp. MINF-07-Sa-05]|uniref:class I SAM-dependent methyltransferase n=1 Tax=Nitrincola salilacus TaxID=3400273 RepID=UPI0039183441